MEAFGAALELHRDRAAGVNAIVRRVVAGKHLELSEHIGGWQYAQLAAGAAVIYLASVNQPVIMIGAQAVETEVRIAGLGRDPIERRQIGGDAGSQAGQGGNVAPVGSQLGNLLARDQAADLVGLGLHLQRVRLDGDNLVVPADDQVNVFPQGLRNVDRNAVLVVGLKAGRADRQVVFADIQTWEIEDSGAIRSSG